MEIQLRHQRLHSVCLLNTTTRNYTADQRNSLKEIFFSFPNSTKKSNNCYFKNLNFDLTQLVYSYNAIEIGNQNTMLYLENAGNIRI